MSGLERWLEFKITISMISKIKQASKVLHVVLVYREKNIQFKEHTSSLVMF